MTFPTVKSSPWMKRRKPRRGKFALWPGEFWKRLVDQAVKDSQNGQGCGVSKACRRMIAEMNASLYGPQATSDAGPLPAV